MNLLKSTLIYGGNASGKSNLLKAFAALINLVKNSVDYKLDQKIEFFEPFKLDTSTRYIPIEFEIDFLSKDQIKYKYKIIYNSNKILHESLFFYPLGQKAKLFIREKNGKITYGEYFKGVKKHKILPNQLLLSKAGKEPIESLQEPYRFFSKYIFCNVVLDNDFDKVLINSFSILMGKEKKSKFRKNVNKLLCASDFGIKSLSITELKENDFKFPKEMSDLDRKKIVSQYKYRIKVDHPLYSKETQIGTETFDLFEESNGTIKLLAVGGLILDALEDGSTIIIDELDKSLHPLLTRMLISLFNTNRNNPNNAQLIFVTHDISIIDPQLLRRDQIWFTEKNFFGATKIFPLSDFTGISKVRTLDNWYINGRFGGIPNLKQSLLNLELTYEKNQEE